MKRHASFIIRNSLLFLIGLFILLTITGCVTLTDPEASQEYHSDVVAEVKLGESVIQGLVSRRPRLNEIHLWLRLGAGAPPDGTLVAELHPKTDDSLPPITVSIPFETIRQSSPVALSFSPQADFPGQEYLLTLKSESGPVQVLGRDEDAYADGAAFQNGSPLRGDLGFRLRYDYDAAAALADLREVLSGLLLAAPLALVTWLPGRFVLHLMSRSSGLQDRLDWGERTALSVGLSLALIPVVMTWTTLLGLRWNRAEVWVGSALLILLYLFTQRRAILTWGAARGQRVATPSLPSIALGTVFVLALAVRLAMVRDLTAPAWVDSVHHTLIIRLIQEHGGFPENYAPYLELGTASYHAGFHSTAALFGWLSGLETPAALLLFGQVLNALSIFAAYLFTTTLTGNPGAGAAAALITGLFTPMPAYYAGWGRYPQLAGLLILPAALFFMRRLWVSPTGALDSGRKSALAGVGLACAGLFLTHYRVIIFLALLLVIDLPFRLLRLKLATWKVEGVNLRRIALVWMGRFGLAAVLAVALTLPWWPATLTTFIGPTFSASRGPENLFSDFTWGYLTTALGKQSLALAGLGLVWSLIQRRGFGLQLVLWVGLLFLSANLGPLHLPGSGLINNQTVEILLFLPISVLGGFLISLLVSAWNDFIPARWVWLFRAGVGLIGVIAALIGARTLLPILNPVTLLFREEDSQAMTWIQNNVPASETILINPFSWGYGLYIGSDGGYWITPWTGRRTMPPPVLYGLSGLDERARQISDLARQVMEKNRDPEGLYHLLVDNDIEYIYLGVRGGPLSPTLLSGSPRFEAIYSQRGTWVFRRAP